jgi:hypothetical protein
LTPKSPFYNVKSQYFGPRRQFLTPPVMCCGLATDHRWLAAHDNWRIAARILFIPTPLLAPVVETLPGLQGVLQDLRAHFEVDVFRWPNAAGEPVLEPTCQGVAEAIKDATRGTPTHVVAFRAATLLALLGLSRWPTDARSLSAVGIVMPNSSLRSLGLSVTGRFSDAVMRERMRDGAAMSEFVLRPYLRELDQREAERLIDDCASGSDLDFVRALTDSINELDLSRERRRLAVPALFLQPPDWVISFHEGEGIQLFKYLAPQAKVRQLRDWPKEPEGTSEVSGPIIEFIGAVERGESEDRQ